MTDLHLSNNLKRAQLKGWSKDMLIEAHLALEDHLASAKAELQVAYQQLSGMGVERLTEELYTATLQQWIKPSLRHLNIDEYLEMAPHMAWIFWTKRSKGPTDWMPLGTVLPRQE